MMLQNTEAAQIQSRLWTQSAVYLKYIENAWPLLSGIHVETLGDKDLPWFS